MLTATYAFTFMTAIGTIFYVQNTEQLELQREFLDDSRVAAVTTIAGATRDFFDVFDRYPDDLDELEGTDGFEYVSSYRIRDLNYRIAEDIDDGYYVFDRALVWAQRPEDQPEDPNDLLTAAANQCEAETFAAAQSFCMDTSIHWAMAESRTGVARHLQEARDDLLRTLSDFLIAYNANTAAPFTRSDGSQLVDGESDTIANIVGYAGTSAACTGSFVFDGAVLDCEDLFATKTATPITYVYRSSDSFVLLADSGIGAAGGGQVVIGQEFEFNF